MQDCSSGFLVKIWTFKFLFVLKQDWLEEQRLQGALQCRMVQYVLKWHVRIGIYNPLTVETKADISESFLEVCAITENKSNDYMATRAWYSLGMGKSKEYHGMPFQTCLIISVSHKLFFFTECQQAASVNTVSPVTFIYTVFFSNWWSLVECQGF